MVEQDRDPVSELISEGLEKSVEEGRLPTEDVEQRTSEIEEYLELDEEETGEYEKNHLIGKAIKIIREINLSILPQYSGWSGRKKRKVIKKILSHVDYLRRFHWYKDYHTRLYQEYTELEDLLEDIEIGKIV